jgi:3-dehydroquinate synthetase
MLMLLTAVWTAAASEPENFIPRQAPGVIRADVNRMLTHPELKSAIDSSREIKNILEKILLKYNLDITADISRKDVVNLCKNDKKALKDSINIVVVNEIGKGEIVNLSFDKLGEIYG